MQLFPSAARALLSLILPLGLVSGGACRTPASQAEPAPRAVDALPELSVMAWNIWHGGREDGEEVGPQRVIDVIRDSGADLVAMQETYGSGERIAQALGYHFHPRGTNVSIHSRFPILEDLSVFEEFQCVGALVELPDTTRLAFYSIWLPYDAEIWAEGTRDTSQPDAMRAACRASARSLEAIVEAMESRLAASGLEDVPVVVAGDFNSMSHLDYGEVGLDQHGAVVDWDTSHVLMRAGFRDAYRECHPRIDRDEDRTWTPRFPEQQQDRIDFVYYRGGGGEGRWRAASSRVIDTHAEGFPSDHAALASVLRRTPVSAAEDLALRVVSYNIKHGAGMDGRVDLERTARVLDELRPDFVCLQEVDLGVERSGGRNQALELGAALDLHPAFGAFMEYGGGHYGMGILSRHPIVDVTSVRLPDGNEPRIALVVEARLPNDERVSIVNVHFDWVADDAFRFAQAARLVEVLRELDTPFVLLGDFNDLPASRTLELFRGLAQEAAKPKGGHLTFPADEPEREIDFVFHGPAGSFRAESVRVIEEALASDHRPVLAELRLGTR